MLLAPEWLCQCPTKTDRLDGAFSTFSPFDARFYGFTTTRYSENRELALHTRGTDRLAAGRAHCARSCPVRIGVYTGARRAASGPSLSLRAYVCFRVWPLLKGAPYQQERALLLSLARALRPSRFARLSFGFFSAGPSLPRPPEQSTTGERPCFSFTAPLTPP